MSTKYVLVFLALSATSGCKGSSGGSKAPETGASNYKTEYAPGKLAIALPDSLTKESTTTGFRGSLLNDVPPGDFPGPDFPAPGDDEMPDPTQPGTQPPSGGDNSASSQGLDQLKTTAQGLQSHLAAALANVLACDAISKQMLAKCSNTFPCEATQGEFKINVTKEFVASLYDALGKSYTGTSADDSALSMAAVSDPSQIPGAMAKAQILSLKGKIGQSVDGPACTISKSTEAGFTNQMSIKANENITYNVAFNDDKSAVNTDVSYKISSDMFESMFPMPEGVDMPEMPKFEDSGTIVIRYNATSKTLSSTQKGTSSISLGTSPQVMEYSSTFNLTEKSDGETAGKLVLNMDNFSIATSFSAGKNGGFATTDYSLKNLKVNSYTLSAVPEMGQMYLVGRSTENTLDMMSSYGMIVGDGTAAPSSFMYNGPETMPQSKFALFVMGDDFTATKSNIVINTLSTSWESTQSFFEEEWDATGTSTYSCMKETKAGQCASTSGTLGGAYSEAFEADMDVFSSSQIEISVTGTNAAALDAAPLYIVPATVDLTAVSPETGGFEADVLAIGEFMGDITSPSASDLSEYAFTWLDNAVSPTDVELSAYKLTFDSNTGAMKFVKVSGLSIVKI